MNHLIIGHFGGQNTGDEAMLSGMLATLDPNDAIQILTKRRDSLAWVDSRVVIIQEASHFNRFKHVNGTHDTVIFCGGTHFHDDYKPLRLIRHWVYLVMQILLMFKAKKLGSRILIIGNGFGPLRYWPTKLLTKAVCSISDKVTVRDQNSSYQLIGLGIKEHERHNDLALFNNYMSDDIESKKILGISVTNHPGYERFLPDNEYLNRIAKSIHTISVHYDISHIRIIVMRGGTTESDRPLSIKLLKKLQDEGLSPELIEHNDDPSYAIKAIGSCSVFIGARFHSVVLGLLAKVEQIGIIPYHSKLNALAEDLNLQHNIISLYEDIFEFDPNVLKLEVEQNTWESLGVNIEQSRTFLKKIIYAY